MAAPARKTYHACSGGKPLTDVNLRSGIIRVALVTAGSRGDVQPLIALGAELRRRGHEVILGVPPNLVALAAGAGLAVEAVGPDTQRLLLSEEGQRWLAAGNVRAFMDALSRIGRDAFPRLGRELLSLGGRVDLLVTGPLTEDGVACVGEALRLPVVAVHTAPLRPTRGYPNCLVTTRRLPGWLNLATGLLFEWAWWRRVRSDIGQFRRELGIPPTSWRTSKRLAGQGALELQAYSGSVVPRLRDYSRLRPIIGFLTLDAGAAAMVGAGGCDRELSEWIKAGRPPVYFGFGSMPVPDGEQTLAMISRVCRSLGVRGLVTRGWANLGSGGHAVDPELIRVTGALNHEAVLPLCRAVVHHGGAGTTAAGVRAGLPALVCSVFADQPFWGERMRDLAVGEHIPYARLTEATLESGLGAVLDQGMGDRAKRLQAALHLETPAASVAADLIEGAAGAGA